AVKQVLARLRGVWNAELLDPQGRRQRINPAVDVHVLLRAVQARREDDVPIGAEVEVASPCGVIDEDVVATNAPRPILAPPNDGPVEVLSVPVFVTESPPLPAL